MTSDTAVDPRSSPVAFVRRYPEGEENAGLEMREQRQCPKCGTVWEQVGVSEEELATMSESRRNAFVKYCCNVHPTTQVVWTPKCPKCYGRMS